ncbi:hypothetical protein [Luteibacter sp. CQ10]|uniref:restriction endonuclease n=1 Tax=Luteibacter sp. CQ10 TaxID=2805821 RepID=UPI0034A4FCF4
MVDIPRNTSRRSAVKPLDVFLHMQSILHTNNSGPEKNQGPATDGPIHGSMEFSEMAVTLASLAPLRDALLDLEPANKNSFEELVGIALRHLTGVSYRQSTSGIQGGYDGLANARSGGIAYECKRYDGRVSRADLLNKIAECALDEHVDLFILAATTDVGAQANKAALEICHHNGMELLVLDWSSLDGVPKLATAIAQIPDDELSSFLSRTMLPQASRTEIESGVKLVKSDATVLSKATAELKAQCDISLLSFQAARENNSGWLNTHLHNRSHARRAFGQALAPCDPGVLHLPDRPLLTACIQKHFQNNLPPFTLGLVGDEGTGKSWSVMVAWLQMAAPRPLLLFVRPDVFDDPKGHDLAGLVSRVLPDQMTDFPPSGKARWERKVRRWLTSTLPAPGLVIVLDGINQRPQHHWSQIVDVLDHELSRIGGRLIVSSRPRFFEDTIEPVIGGRVADFRVAEWSDAEAAAILAKHGRAWADINNASVRQALRNPRLLSVALDVLGRNELEDIAHLSAAHLLMSHITGAAQHCLGPTSPAQFKNLLKEKAKVIWDTAKSEGRLRDVIFRSETPQEGHFFRTSQAEPLIHEVDEFGLPLVLGLYILERLNLASKGDDLASILDTLLDPIAALDEAASAVAAAAVAAFLTKGVSTPVRAALVLAVTGLQNAASAHIESVNAVAYHDVDAYLDVAQTLARDMRGDPRRFAVTDMLLRLRRRPDALVTIFERAVDWLHHVESWSAFAERFTLPGSSGANRDRTKREVAASKEALPAGQETHLQLIREEPFDTRNTTALAVQLLIGLPLANAVPAIASHILYLSLRPDGRSPDFALSALVTFNGIDWGETQQAIRRTAHQWLANHGYGPGIRAACLLLRLTGDSDDALRADRVEGKQGDNKRVMPGREDERPENPEHPFVDPDDLDTFFRTHVRELNNHQQASHDFARVLPSAARLNPLHTSAVIQHLANHLASGNSDQTAHHADLIGPHTQLIDRETSLRLRTLAQRIAMDADGTEGNQQLGALKLAIDLFSIALPTVADVSPSGRAASLELDEQVGLPIALGNGLEEALTLQQGAVSGELPDWVRQKIPAALGDKRAFLRHALLCWLVAHGEPQELFFLTQSEWSARTELNSDCAWLGSLALARAMHLGLLSPAQASPRMSPAVFLEVASLVATPGIVPGEWLDAELERVEKGAVRQPSQYPIEETRLLDRPPIMGASMTELEARIKREGREAAARAIARRDQFALPAAAEQPAHAGQCPGGITFGGVLSPVRIAEIGRSDPAKAARWAGVARDRLGSVADCTIDAAWISILIGLADVDAGASVKHIHDLLTNASTHALPRLVITSILWAASDGPNIDILRLLRVDEATDDQEVFIECAAALNNGRQARLIDHMRIRLTDVLPVRRARAIVALGYLLADADFDATLAHLSTTGGLVRQAYDETVRYRRRNEWAHHWEKSAECAATTLEEWRSSLMLARCADRRALRRLVASDRPWTHRFVLYRLRQAVQEVELEEGRRSALLCGRRKPDAVQVRCAPPSG